MMMDIKIDEQTISLKGLVEKTEEVMDFLLGQAEYNYQKMAAYQEMFDTVMNQYDSQVFQEDYDELEPAEIKKENQERIKEIQYIFYDYVNQQQTIKE